MKMGKTTKKKSLLLSHWVLRDTADTDTSSKVKTDTPFEMGGEKTLFSFADIH